jgi:hypothetical protein
MLVHFFAGFFFESHPVYDQTQGSGAVFFFLYTDNSWVAHMIMKTLASACLLLEIRWQKEREAGRQNAHIRSIMFFSILQVDRLLRRSTHRINWNTPLSMPQALAV